MFSSTLNGRINGPTGIVSVLGPLARTIDERPYTLLLLKPGAASFVQLASSSQFSGKACESHQAGSE